MTTARNYTTRIDPEVESLRARIGDRVVCVPPAAASERGAVEYGVITAIDHRMVYVDYGYRNPVWPELGQSIATHPANLRPESTTELWARTDTRDVADTPDSAPPSAADPMRCLRRSAS
ncbi:hypothetical protein [Nocardia sp. CNY236]|uniref:hypothetical protein n=1 Tax=Nocardia sp. CNY236 TaxID=1169152 RepID=UPI0003F78C37|nr:hypothetical protein [Nocardia sp. CNY236]